MGRHKKVMCKVCYREMRSDVLARHMKQHSMRNESSPVTNISVTNNYNTISGVSTERKDEENENKDEELKKYLIKIENEYQEKIARCGIISSLTMGDERWSWFECGKLKRL